MDKIHSLHRMYWQTRCTKILVKLHLRQNQYENFPSTMPGALQRWYTKNLRIEKKCWPFFSYLDNFLTLENHILWTLSSTFLIFPTFMLVWPFSWPFIFHLCQTCTNFFGTIVHLHQTTTENLGAKADLHQTCWWKCVFSPVGSTI